MTQLMLGVALGVGAMFVGLGLAYKWLVGKVGMAGGRAPSVSQSVEGYDELLEKCSLLEAELRFCRGELRIAKVELGGQVARAGALQSALDALNKRDHAMGCENIELSALVDELQAENRGLRAWIDNKMNTPSYVAICKRDDRAAVIRHLAFEGWSRYKIEKEVFGYTGGGAHKEVKRVLDASREHGTALVRVTGSY